MAEINPLRYRGYYYDAELEMHYLQSRYYDPQIGRFINADDVSFIGLRNNIASYNLFAYCESNPVNYIDLQGYVPYKITSFSVSGFRIYVAFSFTFTGSQLATALVLTAAVIDVVCLIITAATGGSAASVALPIAGIVSVIMGASSYLLDKYAPTHKFKVMISLTISLYKLKIARRTYYGISYYTGLKVSVKK